MDSKQKLPHNVEQVFLFLSRLEWGLVALAVVACFEDKLAQALEAPRFLLWWVDPWFPPIIACWVRLMRIHLYLLDGPPREPKA